MPKTPPAPQEVPPYRGYTKSILAGLGYRATWMPSETMELGAVGYLDDGRFSQFARLKDFGVSFSRRTGRGKSSLEYQSSSGVSTRYKARGESSQQFEGIAKAAAGVRFEFARSGATVFSVPSYSFIEIDDKRALERDLRRVSEWRRNWVVVTKLVKANSATILVAGQADSWVELKASSNVAPGGVEVAEIGAGFSRGRSSGMAVKIVAEGSLTPLYDVFELKPPKIPINRRNRSRLSRPPAAKKAAKRRAPAKKAPAKKATKKATAKRAPARRAARRR